MQTAHHVSSTILQLKSFPDPASIFKFFTHVLLLKIIFASTFKEMPLVMINNLRIILFVYSPKAILQVQLAPLRAGFKPAFLAREVGVLTDQTIDYFLAPWEFRFSNIYRSTWHPLRVLFHFS